MHSARKRSKKRRNSQQPEKSPVILTPSYIKRRTPSYLPSLSSLWSRDSLGMNYIYIDLSMLRQPIGKFYHDIHAVDNIVAYSPVLLQPI